MTNRAGHRIEARALVRIAAPVVIAEIGWMSMGLVDTVMVGPLGPEAIAAVGLGGGVFTAIAIFGMGLLLGLDTLVSQAFGGGRLDECRHLLRQGLWLALLTMPLVFAVSAVAYWTMPLWGLNPEIYQLARPYFAVITLSTVPLLLYAALRRYLQGIHLVRPLMFALVSANLVNILANYLLVYGHLGFPAMGARGSAVATVLARCYMAGFLWVAVRMALREVRPLPAQPARSLDVGTLRRLLTLGLPASTQITLEVGAFTLATAFAAQLDTSSSAAHQIALNISGLAYMVPLGLCSAAAVRVGHAIGAGDRRRAITSGWLAIGLGCALAGALALIMVVAPTPILSAFTQDTRVLQIGATLLAIAAAFQLFDSVQTVAIGALRGLGDTVTPMIINVVVHWVIGLPIGFALCFRFGWGVTGIWAGLSAGLVVASFVLLTVWMRRSRVLLTC
jgi:MATE family multidrug resistance protein